MRPKPSMIGVLPRDGDAKDVRWFKGPERCMMHTFNAHTEGNKIVLYAPFYDSNFFPFFPPVDGSPWDRDKARAYVRQITLDLNSKRDRVEGRGPVAVPRRRSGARRYALHDAADPLRLHRLRRCDEAVR